MRNCNYTCECSDSLCSAIIMLCVCVCVCVCFQVGFKHHKDYVGYTWAKQEEADYLKKEQQVHT